MHRTFYSTIPKFINGASIPTAFGQELALYPDKEQTAISKKLSKAGTSKILPDPVRDYFTSIEEKEARKNSRHNK